jgi:Holliday junction resolvase RusA-like endonuclease
MKIFSSERILACPRPRASKFGASYMPANYKALKKRLVEEFQLQLPHWKTCAQPIRVSIEFMTPRVRIADLDNYVKTILDAMEDAKIFVDDIQVCELFAMHYMGNEDLTTIEITTVEPQMKTHYANKVGKKLEKENKLK